jgi:hypothetical protein
MLFGVLALYTIRTCLSTIWSRRREATRRMRRCWFFVWIR